MSAPGYTIADTTITVGSTSNWPTDTGVVFAIDEAQVVDGHEVQVAGTYNEYIGTVASGTGVTNVAWQTGVGDRNYASGALTRVYIPVSAERENRIVEWGLVHADQDGTLKAGAVDNAGVLASDVVTTAKIANDAVTDDKLDYPRWWQEIGRVTLSSSATTLSLPSLPARKYLKIIMAGAVTGGTFAPLLRFNNDTGTGHNYAVIYNSTGTAVYSAAGSANGIQASTTIISGGSFMTTGEIYNPATSNKIVQLTASCDITNTATGYAPGLEYYGGKWVNASQITRIDFVKNAGTGSLAAGTELIVLGHD